MRVKLDAGAVMPFRAYGNSAGLDLFSRDTITVPAKGSAKFDTGVHIELPKNTAGFLKSKSGLNIYHGITNEGVIDEDYTGSIVVHLCNNSDKDYTVHKGDKISQLVILPVIIPEIELVDELKEKGRGNRGFGSSGR